jgi:hypothetical protein
MPVNSPILQPPKDSTKPPMTGKHEYHYRIGAKQGYILCDEAGIRAALDIAGINLPYPKSSAYVAGKSYTFRMDREVTPAEVEVVLDLLKDECGEVEFRKVFR